MIRSLTLETLVIHAGRNKRFPQPREDNSQRSGSASAINDQTYITAALRQLPDDNWDQERLLQ